MMSKLSVNDSSYQKFYSLRARIKKLSYFINISDRIIISTIQKRIESCQPLTEYYQKQIEKIERTYFS